MHGIDFSRCVAFWTYRPERYQLVASCTLVIVRRALTWSQAGRMDKTLMSLHLSSQVYLYRITYKEISIATWTKDVSLTKNKKDATALRYRKRISCWNESTWRASLLTEDRSSESRIEKQRKRPWQCFLWTPDTTLGRWNTWMRRAIWGASTPARHVACCVRFHPKPVNMY
jgi:hypothetical protein